jgi:serine/threonine protein kinase
VIPQPGFYNRFRRETGGSVVTEEGELIAGRYRLESLVGRGAMGVVWRARDERLDRVVAVKRLHLDGAVDEKIAERASDRAMREARVAARLRHPNAITVYDVVEHAGKPVLVMEFLASHSLSELLAERGTLPPEQVAGIGAQVAAALAAAHAEGVVHRDITPGNVLLTEDGTAKIADFGISRAAGEGTVTGAGFIAGTPAYLAPEVAGGAEAGFPSDVFSLGATLYAAAEGAPPFGTSENPIALLQRIAHGEITPPQRSGPLADVLLCLLRKESADRPAMADAHGALSAVAEGRPVTLPPPRNRTLLLPGGKRPSRRVVIAGTVAAGLLAIGILIGSLLNHQADGQGTSAAPPAGPAPQVPVSTAPPPKPACVAEYRVTNSWPGGYQAEVTVRAGDPLTGWVVRWTLPTGQTVGNLWNGSLSQRGNAVIVMNANYNAVLDANGTTSFGFIANTTGAVARNPALTCENP